MNPPNTFNPPADYRTPYGHRRPITSISLTATLSIGVFVFLTLSFLVIPHFIKILADFHTDLPGTTKLLLEVSYLVNNYFGWLPLLLLPIVAPIIYTAICNALYQIDDIRRLRLTFAVNVFVGISILGSVLLVVFGLFMPIFSLVDAVSGPGSKH
jgi:type II secretory pathway component PulF